MQVQRHFHIVCLSIFLASFGMLSGCKKTAPAKKPAAISNVDLSKIDFIHQASDIKPDPAVTYGKLENGVRYAVMKNDTPTKTAVIRVRIATGSLNEKDNERGLAHFLEHMAFNGSKNIPEGEMIKMLERLGLSFGADTNAHTSFDETVYKLNLPNVSDDLLDKTMMILRETVDNLTLAQDAIDRERGVVQSEKRNMDAPGVRASLENFKFFAKGSRLFDRLPIGTDDTLKTINAEQMRAYYEAYYRPENTFIVFVGDVEPDKAIEKIRAHFEDWKPEGKAGEIQSAGKTPARGMDIGYFSNPEIQTSITFASIKPYTEEIDTIKTRKKNLIDGLGNRILNRRLSALAQKPDAVFISAGAGIDAPYKTMEQASMGITSTPDNWKKALAVGEQELRKALKYGFTEAELKEQIANTRKALQVAVQTSDTRRTLSLAGGILGAFSGETVYSTPASGLERFESYANDITTDDVWKAFKDQWSAIDAPLIFLQTSKKLENPKAEIKAAWEASRAVPVTANVKKDTGKFAYTDFGKPGKVASQKHIEDIDAWTYRFDNNVTLNFKKTDFEKNAIRISVRIGDGSLSLPRKDAALSILAGSVMNAGGLEAHSADEVRTLMAGKAVGGGFGLGTKYFFLSGSTVPSDLTDEFNYLMAMLTAPGYRPEAKARFDKSIKNWYKTLSTTPDGVAGRDVPRLLHSGDGRYGIPSLEKLLAPKTDEVKAWLSPYLAKAQIDITVVGDIDKEEIVKQVARTFGTLPKRKDNVGEYPEMTTLKFPKAPGKPVRLTHTGDANRALLQVFWPGPDGRDILVNRRLSVLRSILSNRLLDIVREDEGAAYSPSAGRSGSRWFPDYGYLSVTMGIKPERIKDIEGKIMKIGDDFRTGNISEDEFTRAIKPILENLDTSLESNSYWADVIGNMQTDSEGIDNFRTREKAFQSMTLEDLKPLAAQIFQNKKAYIVEIVPDKAPK